MSKTTTDVLPTISSDDIVSERRDPIDAQALVEAQKILDAVRTDGESALRDLAVQFGDRNEDEPLVIEKAQLQRALSDLPEETRDVLQRTADRIRGFAEQQLASLGSLDISIEGGRAGHRLLPMEVAGCYAPGGRYPLPSSVLMTVIPPRVAGVKSVWVASPRPAPITLAAAAVAGADALLAVGGAQAIAAMAFGIGSIPKCDIIVGPGNKWVSAAKQLVAGRVAIDMIAGPSELVVVADRSANPRTVALDLLAQAEHDEEALPVLVATDHSVIEQVRIHISTLLSEHSDETAQKSIAGGFSVLAKDLTDAADICNRIAPEHLQLSLSEPEEIVDHLTHYGGLFIGEQSAEVLGDYGAGPNHVLPTSGAARQTGGLSVLDFMRLPTWLRMNKGDAAYHVAADAAEMARLEGLYWHAQAARARQ